MSCSESPCTSPTSPSEACMSSSRTEPTRAPLKNASRERRKVEKQCLSQQIVELEHELSRLLAERAVARCTAPSRVWRSLARRQHGRLVQAQDKNQRLKAKVLHQLQVAKTLEHVLRNRESAFQGNNEPNHSSRTKYPVNDLAALHDVCMDEIDELYVQVDAVFDEKNRRQNSGNGERTLRLESDSGQRFVEMHDTSYAPFPFEKVCSATWRAITTEYVRQNRIIEQYRCTDDEYTSKFWMPLDSSDYQFSAMMTMRKFREDTRMVLVWHGLDINETAAGSSVHSSGSGCLVVERAEDPVTGEPCEDGTVVRMYSRDCLIRDDQRPPKGTFTRELVWDTSSEAPDQEEGHTTLLLKGAEADIASITEAVENILLDDAIGSSEEDLEAIVGFAGL